MVSANGLIYQKLVPLYIANKGWDGNSGERCVSNRGPHKALSQKKIKVSKSEHEPTRSLKQKSSYVAPGGGGTSRAYSKFKLLKIKSTGDFFKST